MEFHKIFVLVVFVCPIFGRLFIKRRAQNDEDAVRRQIVLQRAKRGDDVSLSRVKRESDTHLSRVKRTDILETAFEQRNVLGSLNEDNTVSRPRRSVKEKPTVKDLAHKSVLPRAYSEDPVILSRVKRRN